MGAQTASHAGASTLLRKLAGVNLALVFLALFYELFATIFWSGIVHPEPTFDLYLLIDYFSDPSIAGYTALIFLALGFYLLGDLLAFATRNYAPIFAYALAGALLVGACALDLPLWLEALEAHWNPVAEYDRMSEEDYALSLFHTGLELLRIPYAVALPIAAAVLIRLERR